MAKAKRLPSGSWRVQVYCGKDENGKKIMSSVTAETRKEAERKAALYATEARMQAARNGLKKITVLDAIMMYIDALKVADKSPATISNYKSLSRILPKEMLAMQAQALASGQAKVQEFVLLQKKAGCAPSTIRLRVRMLKSAITFQGFTTDWARVRMPGGEPKEMTIPQDEDVQRLIEHLRKTDDALYLPVLMAATLGLRRGEICALHWEDFDFAAGTVTIRRSAVMEGKVLVEKGTKTRAGKRELFVPDEVMKILREKRQLSGRVLQMNPASVTQRYIMIARALGVPGRFHDLRHYMASVMAALNIPERYAVEIMGHASPEMLKKVYQHTMDKKRSAVQSVLDAHSDALIQGEKIVY